MKVLRMGILGSVVCWSAQAADLGETQIVATRAIGGSATAINGSGANQLNCLIGVGSSMDPQDSPATGQIFNFIYFGRTTCARPVPNTRGGAVDIVAGNTQVKLSGIAKLFDVTDARNAYEIARAPIVTDDGADGSPFMVSKSKYRRGINNPLPVYKVVYETKIAVSQAVCEPVSTLCEWNFVPAVGCSVKKMGTTAELQCTLESLPFYIGPNPGDPKS